MRTSKIFPYFNVAQIVSADSRGLPLGILGLFFLLFSHFHLNNVGGYGLLLPFNSASWIPVSLLIAVATLKIIQVGILRYSKLSGSLFFCCVCLTIPLFYTNANIAQSAFRLIGLWTGFATLLALQQYEFDVKHLRIMLLLILSAIWIESFRYWEILISSYIFNGNPPNTDEFGVYGIFQQRNVFASFIATGIVLSGYFLSQYKSLQCSRIVLLLLLLSPALMIQILFTSASRAGWYGAIMGSICILPYVFRSVPRRVFVCWMISWMIGYGITQFLSNFGNLEIPDKNILSLEGPRTIIFVQALSMFFDKPLFGVGLGNFELKYMTFVAEQYAIGNSMYPPIDGMHHPHNEFLYWGVEAGILPVFGLLISAWSVWKTVCRHAILHRIAIIGIFLPIVLHSQVEFPFYSSVPHWIIFTLLIFYVDISPSEVKRISIRSKFPFRFLGISIPVFFIWFLITTIQTGQMYSRYMDARAPLETLANVPNAIVWRNHLNWAINSAALLVGRDNDRPELIQQYIDWAPQMIAQQPRPLFYEYLILAYLSLNRTAEADAAIEEFRFLFPDREFTVITVN